MFLVAVGTTDIVKLEYSIKNQYQISSPFLSKYSFILLNKCFKRFFPDPIKIPKLVPVHKSGDLNVISKLRPLSHLTALGKNLEKILVMLMS